MWRHRFLLERLPFVCILRAGGWMRALIYLIKSVFQQVVFSSAPALGSVWWALQTYRKHIIYDNMREHFDDFQLESCNSTRDGSWKKFPWILRLLWLVELNWTHRRTDSRDLSYIPKFNISWFCLVLCAVYLLPRCPRAMLWTTNCLESKCGSPVSMSDISPLSPQDVDVCWALKPTWPPGYDVITSDDAHWAKKT